LIRIDKLSVKGLREEEGVLSEHNQPSAIKFSLEETVWFRKGEEIEELVSLSLEPDVTIHDLDQFISVRGSLKMYGEYKKNKGVQREEDSFSYSGKKFVTVVEIREEGISEFHYDFPVDITVPKSRVKNIEELDVIIDMFDYDTKDHNCLTVTTDVSIIGVESDEATIYNRENLIEREGEEKGHDDVKTPEINNQLFAYNEVPTLDLDDEEEEEDTFVVEAKKERTEEDKNTPIPIQYMPPTNHNMFSEYTTSNEDNQSEANNRNVNETADEKSKAHDEELQLVEYVQSDSTDDHESVRGNVQEKEVSEKKQDDQKVTYLKIDKHKDEQEVHRVSSEDEETDFNDQPIEIVNLQTSDDEQRLSEEESEDKNIKLHSHTEREEKESISLTQFFARKDENSVAKMKIYIVQEDDTLEDIAERYEVSVSQILRFNSLEPHQDAYEGQILYIPETQKSHH
jgi:stage VI sporulation protein D